jgi:hypothetical protein
VAKVVIGVDPHKRLNAVVVVNVKGKVLARRTFANSAEGFQELRVFSRQWRPRRPSSKRAYKKVTTRIRPRNRRRRTDEGGDAHERGGRLPTGVFVGVRLLVIEESRCLWS